MTRRVLRLRLRALDTAGRCSIYAEALVAKSRRVETWDAIVGDDGVG